MKDKVKSVIYAHDMTLILLENGKRFILDKGVKINGIKAQVGKPYEVVYEEDEIKFIVYKCHKCDKVSEGDWDLTLCERCSTFYFKCCETRTKTESITIDNRTHDRPLNICSLCQQSQDKTDVLKKLDGNNGQENS